MRILVPVKRVIDPYVKIRVKADNSGVETQNVKMAINPFDEIAVEQALQWREQGIASELVAVSIGDSTVQETLRHALALGIDQAIHIDQAELLEPLNIAKMLAALVKQQSFDSVIMGKQAIDGDHNQTGQMLAALLDWPQATFASEIKLENGDVRVMREVDGGLEEVQLSLPAVFTTDLRLNEPRYATLPNIMKAKRKPLTTTTVAELGVELKQHTEQLTVTPPPERSGGIIVENVTQLVDKLKNEAKVVE